MSHSFIRRGTLWIIVPGKEQEFSKWTGPTNFFIKESYAWDQSSCYALNWSVKFTKNFKEPSMVSLSIFLHWDLYLFFLIFLFNFYSLQVEIERKKSLKPDFEGEELENPQECGVQWWSSTYYRGLGARILTGCLPDHWIQGKTWHGYTV